jgi:hypothetical protein
MKFIIKKFNILFLVGAAVLFLAVALAPPKGEVPVLEPLQSLPEFIKPDIETNISRSANDEQAAPNQEAGSTAGSTEGQTVDSGPNSENEITSPENENSALSEQPAPAPLSDRGQSILLYVVLIGLAIVLVLVVLGVRHHFKNQSKNNQNLE